MRYTFPLLVLYLLLQSCRQEHVSCDYILSHVNIVDVENEKVLPDRWVAIRGERIVKICEIRIDGGDSVRIIEGAGKYLIPGLWDMHAHYWFDHSRNTRLLVGNGITGIREMFGNMPEVKRIRNNIKNGKLSGLEIISSGALIDGVPAIWPGSDTLTQPQDAAALVEKQIADGVDFLKVYSGLNRACYFALVKVAKAKKIPFAGHVPDVISIYEAIDAGQKSAEHLYGIIEVCLDEPEKLRKLMEEQNLSECEKFFHKTFNQKRLDSLLNKLAKSETWICPTLTVLRGMGKLNDTAFINDERKRYMSEYTIKFWNRYLKYDSSWFFFRNREFTLQLPFLHKMEKAGVKVLAGTDFPNPYCFAGFSLHDELQLMVDGGMSIAGALKTATLNPALFLNKEKDYGTVSEGKYASLVLLDKNPLEEIKNTKEICSVFLKGRFFSRKDLREMLEAQKRK